MWTILKSSGEKTTPSEMRLAVDASIWMRQYKNLKSEDVKYFFSKRVMKLLYHRITPVFVFDGKVPEIKRRAVELRRNRGLKRASDGGGECGTEMDGCLDGTMSRLLDVGEMRGRQYNWGDAVDDSSSEDEEVETSEDGTSDRFGDTLSGTDLDFVVSKDLSRSQKLKRLVEMRERRKERMECRLSSMDVFSAQQIENLKRRNMVSHNIRVLEEGRSRRVYGDCRVTYEFVKYQRRLLTTKDLGGNRRSDVTPLHRTLDASEEVSGEDLVEIFGEGHVESRGEKAGSDSPLVCGDEETYDLDRSLDSYPILSGLLRTQEDLEMDSNTGRRVVERCARTSDGDGGVVVSGGEKSRGGFFAEDSVMDGGKRPDVCEEEIEELFDRGAGPERTRGGTDSRGYFGMADEIGGEIDRVLQQMKEVLERFNIPYMTAPLESDSQCGFMSLNGIVDGVITEDNDVLLYGGVVYKNFFKKNKQIERYSLENIHKMLGLGRLDLIKLSYLLGSDYTPGVRGVGPVRALEGIRNGAVDDDAVAALARLYLEPVVEKVGEFPAHEIPRSGMEEFYRNSQMEEDRVRELMFFLDKIV